MRPGHGKSDAFLSAEEYEMPRLVDWLHGLLSKINVSDFFLLSHSLGSFELIPCTTHMLHWNKPDAVIDIIQSKWAANKGG